MYVYTNFQTFKRTTINLVIHHRLPIILITFFVQFRYTLYVVNILNLNLILIYAALGFISIYIKLYEFYWIPVLSI